MSWLVILLIVSARAVLLAHGDETHSINAPGALSPWDIGVLLVLACIGALYAAGALKVARRVSLAKRFSRPAPLASPAFGNPPPPPTPHPPHPPHPPQ